MELGLGLTTIIPPIVYIGGLAILFMTLFYKVEYGLYFLIPILTQQSLLEHLRGYPLGKDFVDLLFLVLIVKWIMTQDKINSKTPHRKSMKALLPMVILWTFVTLWVGAYVLGTGNPVSMSDPRFVHWKNFTMLPILYFIVVNNVKDEKQLKIIFILMTVSMLYMDRSFYNNFAEKDHSSFRNDLRVGSTFAYLGPNELAVFYAQNTIILLIVWLAESQKKLKWLYGITTIFNYYVLMFLYSRGGYIAATGSMIFFGIMKDRRILVLLAIVGIFWQSLLPVSVQQRILMSTSEKKDHSIEARYDMWDQATILIKSSPIFGLGYNITPYVGIKTESKKRNSLHNGYMQLLLEQGAIGILIFLLFFMACFKLGWRLYKNGKNDFMKALGLGFAGCVLAVLAGNIAGSYWFYLNVSGFFWTFLALVVRSLELSDEKDEEVEAADEKKKTVPREFSYA